MKLPSIAVSAFLLASATQSAAFSLSSPATAFGINNRPSSIASTTSSRSRSNVSLMLKPNAIITDDETIYVNGNDKGVASDLINAGVQRQTEDADAVAANVIAMDAARKSIASHLAQYKGQTGASIVYSKLVEQGIDVVNGYSGGAVLPLLDQFHEKHPRHEGLDKPPIRWITNSNENSAGHIAEGMAKSGPLANDGGINSKPPAGVVVATSGPGVTNLITPLQDAICDGVPMVALCGQAATTAPQDAFQQAPAVALTTPCTKWSYQIKSAAELPFVLDYAFFIARHGRPGPVFIDLPKDLQIQEIDDELIESYITSIPMKDEDGQDGMSRFVPKLDDNDLVQEHVLHLGNAEKGILFDVTDEGVVPKADMDLGGAEGAYQLDHHPSETIYTPAEGEENYSRRTGELAVGSEMTNELFDLMRNAKKPIIIAGQGCNDCPEDLKEFAENMNIPVATTLHGLGCFDERHDLALNMLGMHGHPTPNFMIQEADLIVCIGSRFDDRITGNVGQFIPEAKKAAEAGTGGVVHVDIRLSENAKQIKPSLFVHSTARRFFKTVNETSRNFKEANPTSVTDRTEWLNKMRTLQKDFPVKVPVFPTEKVTGTDADGNDVIATRTRMSAQSVVTELNKQLLDADVMDNCLFSTGVGIHQMVAAQLLTWTQPRQMITSGSLGTMGVALGFVIGCKLANGAKMCIAIDGDGSFNMTFTELKTVAEQKIPVKILILDNESQMMVEYWQRLFHDERYLAVTNTINPDYGKLADSFGIKNLYADCEEDLPGVMKEFLFSDPEEPVLMHARIERTPCLPLVSPGKALQDMILEDEICEGLDACAAPS